MNGSRETSIGGPAGAFPSTLWSDLDFDGDPSQKAERLDSISRHYWKPIYRYIRARGIRTNEEAKDLTQSFFVHLFEGGRLARAAPGIHRFRAYLKTAIRNFLANEARNWGTQKRGGKEIHVPLHEVEAGAAPDAVAPEAEFDKEWAREVLDRSMDLLEKSVGAERPVYFRAFIRYAEGCSYAQVAGELEISETQLRNYLTYVRKRLRAIVADLIRGGVDSEMALEGELEELFSLWRA